MRYIACHFALNLSALSIILAQAVSLPFGPEIAYLVQNKLIDIEGDELSLKIDTLSGSVTIEGLKKEVAKVHIIDNRNGNRYSYNREDHIVLNPIKRVAMELSYKIYNDFGFDSNLIWLLNDDKQLAREITRSTDISFFYPYVIDRYDTNETILKLSARGRMKIFLFPHESIYFNNICYGIKSNSNSFYVVRNKYIKNKYIVKNHTPILMDINDYDNDAIYIGMKLDSIEVSRNLNLRKKAVDLRLISFSNNISTNLIIDIKNIESRFALPKALFPFKIMHDNIYYDIDTKNSDHLLLEQTNNKVVITYKEKLFNVIIDVSGLDSNGFTLRSLNESDTGIEVNEEGVQEIKVKLPTIGGNKKEMFITQPKNKMIRKIYGHEDLIEIDTKGNNKFEFITVPAYNVYIIGITEEWAGPDFVKTYIDSIFDKNERRNIFILTNGLRGSREIIIQDGIRTKEARTRVIEALYTRERTTNIPIQAEIDIIAKLLKRDEIRWLGVKTVHVILANNLYRYIKNKKPKDLEKRYSVDDYIFKVIVRRI